MNSIHVKVLALFTFRSNVTACFGPITRKVECREFYNYSRLFFLLDIKKIHVTHFEMEFIISFN